jgi:hypothetical protein
MLITLFAMWAQVKQRVTPETVPDKAPSNTPADNRLITPITVKSKTRKTNWHLLKISPKEIFHVETVNPALMFHH